MAKKNNDQFNNPFSALKGLSVSGEQKQQQKAQSKVAAPKPEPVKEEASDADFFAEMAGLGVSKIEQGDTLEKPQGMGSAGKDATTASGRSQGVTAGAGGVSGRREKQIRRGDLTPQAELDLHGVKAAEVQQKVAWFLENSTFYGFEVVRIITGKGSHSDTGPVLRPLVEEYLNNAGRTYVIEWMRAPQKQGGQGALIAFLRI